MEYIVHGSKNENDSKYKLTLEGVCWNDATKSHTTYAWPRSVEADRNAASFQQTRSKVSLNLLSLIMLFGWANCWQRTQTMNSPATHVQRHIPGETHGLATPPRWRSSWPAASSGEADVDRPLSWLPFSTTVLSATAKCVSSGERCAPESFGVVSGASSSSPESSSSSGEGVGCNWKTVSCAQFAGLNDVRIWHGQHFWV